MNNIPRFVTLAAVGMIVTGFAGLASASTNSIPSMSKAGFGRTTGGRPVEIYTLRNARGAEVRILTYGGIVQSLSVPDKNGKFDDVVLGFDNLDGYLTNSPYFGALVGRYGNRIAKGKFTLNGKDYTLAQNNGQNSLHGGLKGFDKVLWTARPRETPLGPSLILKYFSKDGEEGFPGNLDATAVYTLTDSNELKLEFTATTDRPTVVNLTHHSYFNLAGQGHGDILGHIVYINSAKTTPVDSGLITTGEFADVTGTPFDFRTPTAIGARIDDPDRVLQYGPGYDHNWVINNPPGMLGLQARVTEPSSGRVMEVWSDQPGLQFYAGNFLDGTIHGKGGAVYQRRTGFCMEPQHYPDSPNHSEFPSTVLKPDETYHATIIYRFSAQ